MDKIHFLHNQLKIKAIITNLGKALAAITILLGILITWGTHAENTAHAKAADFCKAVTIGMKADGLLEQAWSAGSNKRHTRWVKGDADQEDWLPVTFIGATLYSRHFCSIDAVDGIVTSRQVKYMD